jgi:protein phosphatase
VRDGGIKLLTRDHSLLNDYLTAMPELTEEQKSELPKNVITRALGMQKDVAVDLQSDEPQAGDTYVLCSDGLNGMLRDEDIFDTIDGASDIMGAARLLIDRANANGGEDNITVVLIRLESDEPIVIQGPRNTTPSAPGGMVDEDTHQASTPPAAPAAPKPE